MPTEKDYYAILGVLSTAEDYIIEAAYKALCKRFHPDIYKGTDAHEKMLPINEAYEVLKDGAKRRAYDLRRREEMRQKHSAESVKSRTSKTDSFSTKNQQQWSKERNVEDDESSRTEKRSWAPVFVILILIGIGTFIYNQTLSNDGNDLIQNLKKK